MSLRKCYAIYSIIILHESDKRIEKTVLRVTIWQHEAVVLNKDQRDRFVYTLLTLMIEFRAHFVLYLLRYLEARFVSC